jgi:hypothetical protein
VGREDDAQSGDNLPAPIAWARRVGRVLLNAGRSGDDLSSIGTPVDVHVALGQLPARLHDCGLPDGVVEFVIDDLHAPARQLLDLQGGAVRPLEPGVAVPWTSISGPTTAWQVALGGDCELAGLEVTGDQHLARCVLAAFPRYP